MSRLAHAQFLIGAAKPEQLPADVGWEVAFAGRSNAGKSSAINALTGRRRLAFVSKTPGRTQQINYFALEGSAIWWTCPATASPRCRARCRSQWERLLTEYLGTRAALRGLVVIMDVRHPLTPLDQQLLDWFAPTGKPVLVLADQGRQADPAARPETASDGS